MEWRILAQRAMNARPIIIAGILAQDPTQVRLPKHDDVVEAFPSDCTDQSLRVRAHRSADGAQSDSIAHRSSQKRFARMIPAPKTNQVGMESRSSGHGSEINEFTP